MPSDFCQVLRRDPLRNHYYLSSDYLIYSSLPLIQPNKARVVLTVGKSARLPTVMSEAITQHDQLEVLLHTHSGVVSREQLDAVGASSRTISAWISTGRLERIRRGLYRSPEGFITHGSLLEAWLSAPYSVICLISALEFHGIGTQMAGRVYLAVPRNHRAPQLEYPPIEVHHFPDAIFKHGVQFHSIGGRDVPIYSIEKTIADTLRYERFIGRDVYLEALQYYLKRKDRDLTALLEAARVCKVLIPMQQSVEALVNDYWNY